MFHHFLNTFVRHSKQQHSNRTRSAKGSKPSPRVTAWLLGFSVPTRSRVKLFSLYENGSPHFCFFRTNAPCSFVTVILFHSKIDNKTLLFYPSLNVHQAAVCSQCCHVSHAVSSPQTETTPQHELPTWPPPAPRVLGTFIPLSFCCQIEYNISKVHPGCNSNSSIPFHG